MAACTVSGPFTFVDAMPAPKAPNATIMRWTARPCLRFTLNTLRQLLERQGNRDQLRQVLLERARQAQPDRLPSAAEAAVHMLEKRCEQLRSELAVVQRRMARE